ncbi:pickpocket protein 28-like [Culicoides brevitarsis]|uniref:pickpocket protein 28-like n=1 Tax=Culicoides brevitarsis TaxID=469753 RepID=UPI00307B2C2C
MYPNRELNHPEQLFKPVNHANFTDFDVESQTSQNNINLTEVVKKNFEEYCDASSIHGFKYIGTRKRIERFLWILICILLLAGCGTQIYEIVGKWRENPLVFLLDTKVSPIEEIEFPAVTICPQRMPNNKRFNFTEFLLKSRTNFVYSDDEMYLFDSICKFCARRLITFATRLRHYSYDIPIINNSILLEVMDEYFPPDSLKLSFCQGIEKNASHWECGLRFKRIFLKEGLCYSFNLLPKSEIFRDGVDYPLAEEFNLEFPEDGPEKENAAVFSNYLAKQKAPYRVTTRRDRLHVRTRAYDDFTDPTCNPDFFVFVHNPHDIPWDLQSSGYLVQIDEFVKNVLTVTPSVIRTDEKLKEVFTPEERGCYFEDERPLKFFKKYSQSNCELECLTNGSVHRKYSSCHTFYMPRTPEMELCHYEIYLLFAATEERNADNLEECGCLPDCNSIEYSVTIQSSHTPDFDDTSIKKQDLKSHENEKFIQDWMQKLEEKLFLWKNKSYNFEIPLSEAMKKANYSFDFDIWKYKYSEIEVHYANSEFLARKRVQSYSLADFISQIGGILGCFLGISIFSMVEIVYFCTVQFMKRLKHQVKDEKKDPEVQIQPNLSIISLHSDVK